MAENADTLTHTIEFDEPIDKIIIIPDEGGRRTANFFFGTKNNLWVNLDLCNACCEKYYLYINGKELKANEVQNRHTINIQPSTSMTFTFSEKDYHSRKNWSYQKNTMTIHFNGGDRIRVNRDEQYCGSTHPNIYTRGVYLENDAGFRLLGFV
jgi:hypothetical protein